MTNVYGTITMTKIFSSLFSDPSQPQILSDTEDMLNILSLNRIELRNSPPESLYSPTQVKRPLPQMSHSPPELLHSPPRSLTNQIEHQIIHTTPVARSQSNLDTLFKSRKLKLDSEINDNNKSKSQVGQKFQLQRQYSCKDVPEKLPKTNDNGIRHSASEINLNNIKSRPNSRKNSFSKPSRNTTNIPNISRIPNPLNNKTNENHVSASKNEVLKANDVNSTSTHYHSTKSSEVEQKPSLVKVPVDKPIGLDLEEFLPVSF